MQPLLLPVTLESLVTSTGMVLSFMGVLFLGSILLGSLFPAEHPRGHHDIRFRAFFKDNLAAIGTIAAKDRYN